MNIASHHPETSYSLPSQKNSFNSYNEDEGGEANIIDSYFLPGGILEPDDGDAELSKDAIFLQDTYFSSNRNEEIVDEKNEDMPEWYRSAATLFPKVKPPELLATNSKSATTSAPPRIIAPPRGNAYDLNPFNISLVSNSKRNNDSNMCSPISPSSHVDENLIAIHNVNSNCSSNFNATTYDHWNPTTNVSLPQTVSSSFYNGNMKGLLRYQNHDCESFRNAGHAYNMKSSYHDTGCKNNDMIQPPPGFNFKNHSNNNSLLMFPQGNDNNNLISSQDHIIYSHNIKKECLGENGSIDTHRLSGLGVPSTIYLKEDEDGISNSDTLTAPPDGDDNTTTTTDITFFSAEKQLRIQEQSFNILSQPQSYLHLINDDKKNGMETEVDMVKNNDTRKHKRKRKRKKHKQNNNSTPLQRGMDVVEELKSHNNSSPQAILFTSSIQHQQPQPKNQNKAIENESISPSSTDSNLVSSQRPGATFQQPRSQSQLYIDNILALLKQFAAMEITVQAPTQKRKEEKKKPRSCTSTLLSSSKKMPLFSSIKSVCSPVGSIITNFGNYTDSQHKTNDALYENKNQVKYNKMFNIKNNNVETETTATKCVTIVGNKNDKKSEQFETNKRNFRIFTDQLYPIIFLKAGNLWQTITLFVHNMKRICNVIVYPFNTLRLQNKLVGIKDKATTYFGPRFQRVIHLICFGIDTFFFLATIFAKLTGKLLYSILAAHKLAFMEMLENLEVLVCIPVTVSFPIVTYLWPVSQPCLWKVCISSLNYVPIIWFGLVSYYFRPIRDNKGQIEMKTTVHKKEDEFNKSKKELSRIVVANSINCVIRKALPMFFLLEVTFQPQGIIMMLNVPQRILLGYFFSMIRSGCIFSPIAWLNFTIQLTALIFWKESTILIHFVLITALCSSRLNRYIAAFEDIEEQHDMIQNHS